LPPLAGGGDAFDLIVAVRGLPPASAHQWVSHTFGLLFTANACLVCAVGGEDVHLLFIFIINFIKIELLIKQL
jgi:hypothetical protein